MHEYILGTTQVESNFAEKNLGVLVDAKLNMSQHSDLVVKASNDTWATLDKVLPLGQVREPLCSALVSPHLDCWVQF